MYYFIPLYFFAVLNSVRSVENNETLKIENSDSSGHTNFSVSGNPDRNRSIVATNLDQNASEVHHTVKTNLTVNEKPLNFSLSEKVEKKVDISSKIDKSEKNLDSRRENFMERPPFEPSPTLGTVIEYEFNKVPVKPAFPEPRLRFPSPDNNESPWIARDNIWKASEPVADHEKPEAVATMEEVKPDSKDYTTVAGTTALLGTTWNNKGHFPTVSSVDRPYQFYHHQGFAPSGPSSGYGSRGPTHPGLGSEIGPSSHGTTGGGGPYSSYETAHSGTGSGTSGYGLRPSTGHGSTDDGFAFNKPVEVLKKPNWNYYGPKTQLDCCPDEKPIRGKTYQGYGYDGLSHYGYSPWTKIIKFLTTIIPLGILISALTPSVIQITNVNDTQNAAAGETFSRYRSAASETSKKEIADHLLSSLEYIEELNQNGCEYRVFCELLSSAKNTKNSKKNVDSLLDSFSERNFDITTKKKELERVFDAVRTHDCKSIPCELIRRNNI